MVKHTQKIRRQKPTYYLSVFDHFVGLPLKELRMILQTHSLCEYPLEKFNVLGKFVHTFKLKKGRSNLTEDFDLIEAMGRVKLRVRSLFIFTSAFSAQFECLTGFFLHLRRS